jgi:hypothetical protein
MLGQIKMEVPMPEYSEQKTMEQEQRADSVAQSVDPKKQMLHFMLGAQRMMLEEAAFTAVAMLDRVRTETHLAGELAARLAEAHSVRDLNAMGKECGKHQLEFLRRECDRQFRHGERLIEATSDLLNNRP